MKIGAAFPSPISGGPHIVALRGQYDGSPTWTLTGDDDAIAEMLEHLTWRRGWDVSTTEPDVFRADVHGSPARIERALRLIADKLGLRLVVDVPGGPLHKTIPAPPPAMVRT